MARLLLLVTVFVSACGRSGALAIGDVVDASVPADAAADDMSINRPSDMYERRDLMRHHRDLSLGFDLAFPIDLAAAPDLTPPEPDMNRGVWVTTFAGSGNSGSLDGPADVATFMCPSGIAVDSAGSIYVADGAANAIRKITPDRMVSTLAGNGTAGYVDGPGATAEFHWPAGVAFDPVGNLIVAEWLNNRIRAVAPDGTTSTVAGNGAYGYVDGPAATAEFMQPTSLTVTDAIYVGDVSYTIRKITFAGTVSTFSGSGQYGHVDGPASTARYQSVSGFAPSGSNLLITDVTTVRSVMQDGSVSTIVPSVPGGATGITVDDLGAVYFATAGYNNQVLQISPTGAISALAGAGPPGFADGPGGTALFGDPHMIVARGHGDILVCDCDNHRIREITF